MVDDRDYGADEELISNALKLRYTEAVSVAGSGVFLTDASGRELLDFEAGGCVASIGYGHPRLAKAIAEQYEAQSTNCLPVMANEVATKLARRLIDITPGGFASFSQCVSTQRINGFRRPHVDNGRFNITCDDAGLTKKINRRS